MPPTPTLFPYTTLFRSCEEELSARDFVHDDSPQQKHEGLLAVRKARLIRANALQDNVLQANPPAAIAAHRSEEHTSELQSLRHLVCRLLLEKKKKKTKL